MKAYESLLLGCFCEIGLLYPLPTRTGRASTNALSNGLLLRKDIHALFDAGLLTIGPDLVVYVTAGVDDPYYRSLDGKDLTLTAPPKMSKEALRKRLVGHGSSELNSTALPG